MSAQIDLYTEALAACVTQHVPAHVVDTLHATFWRGGNRIPAILTWASVHGVTGLSCPMCAGSGCITETLDVNAVVSVATDAPCLLCCDPVLNIKGGDSLP